MKETEVRKSMLELTYTILQSSEFLGPKDKPHVTLIGAREA